MRQKYIFLWHGSNALASFVKRHCYPNRTQLWWKLFWTVQPVTFDWT